MKLQLILLSIILIGCTHQIDLNNYSKEEINYFTEIALGAEFGNETPVIKKWTADIRIKVNGEPTVTGRFYYADYNRKIICSIPISDLMD